jgi:cell division protein FtsI/penicillin-binding protein 2
MLMKRKEKKKKESDILMSHKKGLRNRETNVISFLFIGLFLLMACYLVYFTVAKADSVVNNSYNKRIDALSEKVVRGSILACDGTVLAETKTDASGNEYRYYPFGKMYCHVVGLNMTKSGVEGQANYELLSTDGNIINSLTNELTGKKSEGNDVVTTIVPKLQQAAYNALGSNKGAVIVMEPSSGKILAMVSKPDFDPNVADEYYEDWLKYDSSDSVLLNRAVNGLYAPGSTFKILTSLEFIRDYKDYADYEYECEGSAYVSGGTTIPCADDTVHGVETIEEAFAHSCNSFFSTIGFELKLDKFKQLCETFGFNKNLNTGLDASISSFTLDGSSSVSEIQETCIGQGKTMISPIHNLMIISAIANKGVMMTPYVVMQTQTSNGKILKVNYPSSKGTVCTEEEASYIASLCRGVVTDGTAQALKWASYEAAGKTGTAQYDNSGNAHSWFVGFAPYENPEISICVILEGGYSGSSATYVAKTVLDAYFE